MSEQLAEQVEEKVETPVEPEGAVEQPKVKQPKQEMTPEEKARGKRRLSDEIKQKTYLYREEQRKNAKLAERLKELEEQSKLKAEPNPDDYADDNKLKADQDKWRQQERDKLRQEVSQELEQKQIQEKEQRRYNKQVETYAQQRETAKENYENYEESEKLVDSVANMSDSGVIRQVILGSEQGTQIVDYLGNNPDELEKISEMSPLEQARVLGRIESKLDAKPIKKTSSAPDPIRSEKGGASASVYKGHAQGKNESWVDFCKRRK